jgi:hypothetical protein
MDRMRFTARFEEIVESIYVANGYHIVSGGQIYKTSANEPLRSPDFIMENDGSQFGVETKFYRSTMPTRTLIRNAAAQLAEELTKRRIEKGKLVLSLEIPEGVPKTINDLGPEIEIVDLNDLYRLSGQFPDQFFALNDLMRKSRLETASPPAKDEGDVFSLWFGDLVGRRLNSEQKTRTLQDLVIQAADEVFQNRDYDVAKEKIRDLITRLEVSRSGPRGAKAYESLCLEAIKELFSEDFGDFKEQHRIADGFHRLDFISSIKSENEFWNSLRDDFRSRYVVFEVKNYPGKVSQDQIYSTEKYLFTNALRSVAILIARNGENKGAYHARQGALREAGKLILMLTQEDVIKMLQMKIAGDEVISVLADKLDDLLTKMAR